jgi:hypothetical protein
MDMSLVQIAPRGLAVLGWKRRERQEREKQQGGVERVKLKEKVGAVLAKGSTPEAGKWNNHDLKVTIQWFKHDGDKAMPKNRKACCFAIVKHTPVLSRVLTRTRQLNLHPLPIMSLPNLAAISLLWRLLAFKPLPMLLPL